MTEISRETPVTPQGYEQITGLSSVKSPTIPAGGCKGALIQATTQNVRWRDDGTNPTASIGMQLAAGNTIYLSSNQLQKLRFIQESASAVVNISYYA